MDASAVKAPWNPLSCSGALPVPLETMAKVIALALLLTNHVRLLPDPFLPFIPGLDSLMPGAIFQTALQTVFVASALALLFNRAPRVACLALGGSILLAVTASKAYYGNNKTFCGLMLLFAGLYEPGRAPWMHRAQLVVVYFGAGLNKLLDPDWRSGLFFEHWSSARLKQPVYLWASQALPPLVAGKIMSWTTIAAELGLAAALPFRRLWPGAIWVSILFHSGLLLFTGTTFTMFFYGMQASMLAFVEWPRGPATVIYDGDCGFCNKSRRWMERIDFERLFEWRAFQSGIGARFGIGNEALARRLHLVVGGRVYQGFRAFQMMLLYNPVTYLVMTALIAAPRGEAPLYRRIVVTALLAFFFPLFRPVGEAVYDLVARNRHRLAENSACAVEE
jgi:predicted DCC family thiol-disulfide oxidoreductase YuxK